MKSVLLIVTALRLVCPHMGQSTRVMYANIIAEEAKKAGIDPLLPVAVVQHESRWLSVADNGKCIGLGQVCLNTQSACADGLDTLACQARRQALFDGPTNLRTSIRMLGMWRKRCLALTGHAEVRHILSGYAGTGGQCRGTTHRIVQEIIEIRRKLKRRIR